MSIPFEIVRDIICPFLEETYYVRFPLYGNNVIKVVIDPLVIRVGNLEITRWQNYKAIRTKKTDYVLIKISHCNYLVILDKIIRVTSNCELVNLYTKICCNIFPYPYLFSDEGNLYDFMGII